MTVVAGCAFADLDQGRHEPQAQGDLGAEVGEPDQADGYRLPGRPARDGLIDMSCEQLAGDTVGVDEATGVLVAGAMDRVKSPDPGLTAQQRADELHDMISTTSSK